MFIFQSIFVSFGNGIYNDTILFNFPINKLFENNKISSLLLPLIF